MKENSKITVGQGYHNYDDLKKKHWILLSQIFIRKQISWKNIFSKQSMNDVPFLKLAYIDLSKTKDADSLIGFSFGGDIDEKLNEIKK